MPKKDLTDFAVLRGLRNMVQPGPTPRPAMIPTHRRNCLPSDLPAWDSFRLKRLQDLKRDRRPLAFLWFRFFAQGTLPS